MNLVPVRPPGANARKARAFAADIVQLRAQGYTFEAIREALAGAGVQVSNSTVQREAARASGTRRAHGVRRADPSPTTTQTASPPSPPTAMPLAEASQSRASQPRTALRRAIQGKEDAEAFFSRHHSNPLLPPQETS